MKLKNTCKIISILLIFLIGHNISAPNHDIDKTKYINIDTIYVYCDLRPLLDRFEWKESELWYYIKRSGVNNFNLNKYSEKRISPDTLKTLNALSPQEAEEKAIKYYQSHQNEDDHFRYKILLRYDEDMLCSYDAAYAPDTFRINVLLNRKYIKYQEFEQINEPYKKINNIDVRVRNAELIDCGGLLNTPHEYLFDKEIANFRIGNRYYKSKQKLPYHPAYGEGKRVKELLQRAKKPEESSHIDKTKELFLVFRVHSNFYYLYPVEEIPQSKYQSSQFMPIRYLLSYWVFAPGS